MNRQHPFFSPVGCLGAVLLVGLLAVTVFFTGGLAFSPGGLSAQTREGAILNGYASHAEFEADCNQCHAPWMGVEAARCERCHTGVAEQRQTGNGLHGKIESAGECVACHGEHNGRDFDMTASALARFDHERTAFSLAQHKVDYQGASIGCADCHQSETDYVVVAAACADCHGAAEPDFIVQHVVAFGEDCLACHDGVDSMANFDHATTAFLLDGAHANAECAGCHTGGVFADAPTECVACHAEPEVHQGLFGADCAACHTAAAWSPAMLEGQPFDHARDTRFSLVLHTVNYDDADFTCRTCHLSDDFTQGALSSFAETLCADCHGAAEPDFMVEHTSQFGGACLDCHDGTGEMANFDHSQIWPLEGQHTVIECAACHVNQVFAGTPTECVDCHAEPDIHFGLFGFDCAACHTVEAWTPARLTEHTFPLDHGGEGEVACETCHTRTYTGYTCYGCHEHQPAEMEREHREEGISPAELHDCASCHPTGREDEAEGRENQREDDDVEF